MAIIQPLMSRAGLTASDSRRNQRSTRETPTMISDTDGNGAAKKPQDFKIRSFKIDLTSQAVTPETVPCEDLEDALGGIARGFKLLENCATEVAPDLP